VGDDLAARFREQPPQLAGKIAELGATNKTPYAVGEQVIGAVGSRIKKTGVYGEASKEADKAWEALRQSDVAGEVMDFRPFHDRIVDTLSDFEDAIPAAVTKRIQGFIGKEGGEFRPFTVSEAVKLRTLINQRYEAAASPAERKALTAIRRELGAFMDEAVPGGVGQVKTAFAASAQLARDFKAKPLKDIIGESAQPDNLYQRIVLSGNVADLQAVKSALMNPKGPVNPEIRQQARNAWEDVRRRVISDLHESALSPNGEWSQSAFERVMDKIGPEKLKALFSEAEIAKLEMIRRAGRNLFTAPASGGVPLVNNSGTGAALLNVLGRVPVGGNMTAGLYATGRQAIENQARITGAQAALTGAAVSPEAAAIARAEAARRAGLLGARAPSAIPAGLLGEDFY
jgi:hypothetical protein